MADERIVTQLVLEGAAKFEKDFASAASAVGDLTAKLAGVDRIRTQQLQQNITAVREAIDKLGASGAQGVKELSAALETLNQKLQATSRISTSKLVDDLKKLQGAVAASESRTVAATVRGAQGVAANRQAIQGTQVAKFADTSLASKQAQALAEAQRQAAQAAVLLTQRQGVLQRALAGVATVMAQVRGVTNQATQSTTAFSNAINQSSQAQGTARGQGITYLSTLSAIHAASFLATGSTFTLAGSFFTLAAAFSKMGPGAVLAGGAVGGLLFIFGQINNAVQLLQQVLVGLIRTLATVGAAASVALVAAGTAAVKITADVETQLGIIKAIEQPTQATLQRLSDLILEISNRFGISAKDVAAAASLYVRAGGDIDQAIDGGLAAVIALQTAAAGELSAADAARSVAVGLKAFSKDGVTAEQVANALTRALQGSALSATEVNQAFQQAVPGAVTLGISLDQLSAIIGVLGNNALRGTVAGTSFKQFLLDLVNPSSKASETLASLGVNLFDVNKKVRPFQDVLQDLSDALDGVSEKSRNVSDEVRAQAIAVIFGSRAALSSNILIRESVKGLREFEEATKGVTAGRVTEVLLLPLNKQLEILKTRIENLGVAFGAPLLAPVRAIVAQINTFVSSLVPAIELAGQAVSTVLAGRGFGSLQQKITELVGNNALSSFLIELVNSFNNVRDVIVNQIVPAIGDFITSMGNFGSERIDETATAFTRINSAIQTAGVVSAVLIRQFAGLIQGFINAEGAGGKLRETIENLALRAMTAFLGTAVALAPALAGAIAILPVLNKLMILSAQVAVRAAGAYKEFALKLSEATLSISLFDMQQQISRAEQSGNTEEVRRLIGVYNDLIPASLAARKQIAEGFDFTALQNDIDSFAAKSLNIEASIKSMAGVAGNESQVIIEAAEQEVNRANAVVEQAVEQFELLGTDAAQATAQAAIDAAASAENALALARRSAGGIRTVFHDLVGDLPDILSNLADATRAEIAEIDSAFKLTGSKGGPTEVVDTKAIESARTKILELGRDLARTLDNVATDSSQRVVNIVDKALEKLGDISDKALLALEKLQADTNKRVGEILQATIIARLERTVIQDAQKLQEEVLRNKQSALDEEERIENRTLEHTRLARQRNNEDTERGLQEIADAADTSYQRQQDAAERAFSAQQQARERALSLSQSAEEKALQGQLTAQKILRDNARRLSEAKTPDERAQVNKDIAQARDDAKFEKGQQDQLDALKTRHDQQRLTLQRSAEQEQIGFRIRAEDALTQRRIANELVVLARRRTNEGIENDTRTREEDLARQRSEARAVRLREFREGQELALQAFRDELENASNNRRIEQIRQDGRDRAAEIVADAQRQAGELIETTNQQLEEQRQQVDRSIRTAIDRLIDLEDSLPSDVLPGVIGILTETRLALLGQAAGVLDKSTHDLDTARALLEAGRITGETRLRLTQDPNAISQQIVASIPAQVITAQTLVATNLVLPGQLLGVVAQGMYLALTRAGSEGTFEQSINFDTLLDNIVPPLDSMQRFFKR